MVHTSAANIISILFLTHSIYTSNIDTYLDIWCKEPLKVLDFKSTHPFLHVDYESLNKEAQYKCALWLKHIPNKNWTSNITNMFQQAFKPKLTILKISDGLVDIDESFFELEMNLRFLDLSGNGLSYLKLPIHKQELLSMPTLTIFDYLQGFDLSQNMFNNISFLNTRASIMEDLDLSENQLQEVPNDSLQYFRKLKKLILKKNKINKFENGTLVFPSLDYLDVSSNHLNNLQGIEKFVNLRILLLSNNLFPKINSNLLKPEIWSLKELHLDYCQIQTIEPDSFINFPNIEKLRLDHNLIRKLDINAFRVLKRLESLDISHNFLVDLDPNLFAPLKKLLELNIEKNNIKILNYKGLTSKAPSMKEIRLMYNDFECDEFKKMLIFLEDKVIEVVGEEKCDFEEKQPDIYCCKSAPNNITTVKYHVTSFRIAESTEKIDSLKRMINITSHNVSHYIVDMEKKTYIFFTLFLCQFALVFITSSFLLIIYTCRKCGKKRQNYPNRDGTVAKII